jgi:GH24 family phage-related lysozyme (muramidase)
MAAQMEKNKMIKLLEQLKRHEGFETHIYDDSGKDIENSGRLTIGIGRNVDPRGGLGITEEEAMYLLEADVLRCIKELSGEYPWFGQLDEVRQEAIINIFFNLGSTKFRLFRKAIQCLEGGDTKGAAIEFLDSKWSRQVGNRSFELAEQLTTGRYAE